MKNIIEDLEYRIRMYKAWCEEKCTAQGTLWRWAIFVGIKKDFTFHMFAYEFAGRELMQGFLDGMNQMESFLKGTGLFTSTQSELLGNPESLQPVLTYAHHGPPIGKVESVTEHIDDDGNWQGTEVKCKIGADIGEGPDYGNT